MSFAGLRGSFWKKKGGGASLLQPDEISNLYFWHDVNDVASRIVDSGAISILMDKSSSGFNLTQTDPTKRPLFDNTTLGGGLCAAKFDGVDDFLETEIISPSPVFPMTLFIIAQKGLSQTGGIWSFAKNLSVNEFNTFYHQYPSQIGFGARLGSPNPVITLDYTTGLYAFRVELKTSEASPIIRAYSDLATGFYVQGMDDGLNKILLGRMRNSTSFSSLFDDGYFVEAFGYKKELTPEERIGIGEYIIAKYGINAPLIP